MLQSGGNAADAGIAVAAALSVLYPHMTGVGGDAFVLYYQASDASLWGYNASGAAAARATIPWYRGQGVSSIPERGAPAALTVPGAVDAWCALHERFGSLRFEQLLQPAIEYAERGAPVARSLADALALHHALLRTDEGASGVYGGEPVPQPGGIFKQPQLAHTLRSISQGGRDWFYSGAGARAIDSYCRRIGSPLRLEDLAAHRGFFCDPLRAPFFAFESVTMPPNSQGIGLLIAQRIWQAFAGRDLPASDSAALVHAWVEAIKLAFEDRDRCVGDPQLPPTWHTLLADDHIKQLSARIDPFQARAARTFRADAGDTTYFAAVDARGNAVSYIQSLFHSFGAAVAVPELGVLLNNRGSAFSLVPKSIRALAPGRRPYHTLMPCMLLQNRRPWLVHGSMGGEGQAQTGLTLSARIARFGMDPQAAIEAPRWRWGQTWLDEPASLAIESRFGDACIAGLRARGHRVDVVGEWEEGMGHAGAILIGEDGVLQGGADPRGDGAAVGF